MFNCVSWVLLSLLSLSSQGLIFLIYYFFWLSRHTTTDWLTYSFSIFSMDIAASDRLPFEKYKHTDNICNIASTSSMLSVFQSNLKHATIFSIWNLFFLKDLKVKAMEENSVERQNGELQKKELQMSLEIHNISENNC